MKPLLVVVLFAGLGILAGTGVTYLEFRDAREQFSPLNQVVAKLAPMPRADGARPKAHLVDGRKYDFGTMDRLSQKSHTFLIRNDGNAPLSVELGRTTCKCTVSDVSDGEIAPGDTAQVTLQWDAKSHGLEPEFTQSAEIHTNDPDQPVITVTVQGLVIESVRTVPARLVFPQVSTSEVTQAEFRVLNYQTEDFKILAHKFTEAATASKFQVEFRKLTDQELAQERLARSGWLATLSIQPGLPLGPISQVLKLNTNFSEAPVMELPLQGATVSDMKLAAPTKWFNREASRVDLGIVEAGQAVERTINMFVSGPHRESTQFKVGRIDPDTHLQATISDAVPLNQGKTWKYEITIRLKPTQLRLNRMGTGDGDYGVIMLETTHPTTPQIPIYVKFAVGTVTRSG